MTNKRRQYLYIIARNLMTTHKIHIIVTIPLRIMRRRVHHSIIKIPAIPKLRTLMTLTSQRARPLTRRTMILRMISHFRRHRPSSNLSRRMKRRSQPRPRRRSNPRGCQRNSHVSSIISQPRQLLTAAYMPTLLRVPNITRKSGGHTQPRPVRALTRTTTYQVVKNHRPRIITSVILGMRVPMRQLNRDRFQ